MDNTENNALQEEKIDKLLDEFTHQRDELNKMVDELGLLKTRIGSIFPDSTPDVRYVRFFEEKVKAATELFKAILDIRKEIGKSLKEEIEIRKKMGNKTIDLEDFLSNGIDIRAISKKVEKFKDNIDSCEPSEALAETEKERE